MSGVRNLLKVWAVLLMAALAASVLMAVVLAGPARAATLTVTTAADEQNTNDQCSLREAIINSNRNDPLGSTDCAAGGGEDVINFNLGGSPATITLASELPFITDSAELTIDGGSTDITVSGNDQVRVFLVAGPAKLTVNNLTVADGRAYLGNGGDGGIYNHGTLTVTNSTLSGSSASGFVSSGGGGIYSDSTLTVSNSTLSGNSAQEGGGIDIAGGTLTLSNSTLSGNSAAVEGGGIDNSGTATLKNTIVANSTSGGNCSGTITNGGYNLDSGTSCGFGAASNSLSSVDPLLGALADNGGPTKTHALLEGSPAIDEGNSFGATTDQRGFARPQGPASDIGSFEAEDTIAPWVKRVVPAENATGIAPAANVSAFFSEAMRVGSINTNTVKLFKTGTTTPLAAVVSYDAERKRATLNPDANLQLGSRYRAVVTTGARDLAGNQLDQDQNASNGRQQKVWFFTVRN